MAYCECDGDVFLPTTLAQGPWGQTISGHVVGGLLARSVERAHGDSDFQPSRLTVDMVRAPVLERAEIAIAVQRDGRRIRLVDASMTQQGNVVARASALFLRRGEQPLDPVWPSPIPMPPVPLEPQDLSVPMVVHSYGWGADGAGGAVLPTDWPLAIQGQKYAWVRHIAPILQGELAQPDGPRRNGRRPDKRRSALGQCRDAIHEHRLHAVDEPFA